MSTINTLSTQGPDGEAAVRAVISAALDALIISATVDVEPPGPVPQGESCFGHHRITVRIGDRSLEASGWTLCGYLPRGACVNLDGSGLDIWGDAQPGGWTSCRGDGNRSGAVSAHTDDSRIWLEGGDGCGSSELLSIAAILGLPEDWEAVLEECVDLSTMVDHINAEIGSLDTAPAEPSAEPSNKFNPAFKE